MRIILCICSLDQARDYYETIYQVDIHRVDKVRRSSERTRLLLRSYARNTGSAISFSKMSEDIKENDNASITYETISDYVDALMGGKDNIEKGAETLKNLAEKIDTNKMKTPSFLMVLIGVGQYAFRRPDGVFVVPIGCLKD